VGISATEEEYQEAKQRKKPMFVFLEKTAYEFRQEQFIQSITGYVSGHWRKFFSTPEELEELVTQALQEYGIMSTADSTETGANERVAAAFHPIPATPQGVVWMQVAWATLRDEEVIDPLQLIDPIFQRQVQRLAHEGDPPLFDYSRGSTAEGSSARLLRIVHGNPRTDDWREGYNLVAIELYENGTLSVYLNITSLEAHNDRQFGSGTMYSIDPDDILQRLAQVWGFAARWWGYQDPHGRHEPLVYNVALHHVENKRIEKVIPRQSISMPLHNKALPDLLVIYERARKVARVDLQNPGSELKRILELMKQQFPK